jgi:hypothetical protein
MDPQSQDELLKALFAIFPPFRAEWLADQEGGEWSGDSLHSVYQSFLPYVSRFSPAQDQIQRLADLVNDAVAAGGDSENAVSTCFLEHLGQVGLLRPLRSLLSAESRTRLRA